MPTSKLCHWRAVPENLATATRSDQPVYLLYSAVTETTVEDLLGVAEYSYFFVREIFRRMLEKHAEVVVVTDPPGEVDRLYDTYRGQGRECVFLSFAPPHKTFIELRCPTIPVFAWEFDTIPTEVWDDEPRNDWRFVLSKLGRAITHSKYSVEAVKSAMGVDFPVVSIPAPVWDTIRQFCGDIGAHNTGFELFVQGRHFDSRDAPAQDTSESQQKRLGIRRRLELSVSHFAWWYRQVLADLLPTPLRIFISKFVRLIYSPFRGQRSPAPSHLDSIRFDEREIVYTSVFNPADGRKNWRDMMTAFCTACAACENATLIFKFIHRDSSWEYNDARAILSRLPPYRCRVVVIDGFLNDDSYRQLIARSAFVVTSSLSEGQCLPLLEFLSCGKPAVSTSNTAMQDYLDGDIGFIARSSPELCCWPHDTRNVLRAHRYRVDWQSLKLAFQDSYRVATHDPKRYEQMGARAIARMRDHCSEAVALSKLESFLVATGTRIAGTRDAVRSETSSAKTAQAQREIRGPRLGSTQDQTYKYNASDEEISDYLRVFTSRIGDGTGDPEEEYLSLLKVIVACKANARYLDIGSGWGRIIDIVHPSAAVLVGLEPDPERFEHCFKTYHDGARTRIFNTSSLEFRTAYPQERFDVITLSMVLQHVATSVCDQILLDVRELLAPDGLAIIATTQQERERFIFQFDKTIQTVEAFDRYALASLDQPFGLPVRYFSKISFQQALERAGLQVVHWGQFSYIRPERLEGFAALSNTTPDAIRDVGDSQYAVVKRPGDQPTNRTAPASVTS